MTETAAALRRCRESRMIVASQSFDSRKVGLAEAKRFLPRRGLDPLRHVADRVGQSSEPTATLSRNAS